MNRFCSLLTALTAVFTLNAFAQNVGPIIISPIADRTIYTTGVEVIDLVNHFNDPDANFDVRMITTLGTIDIDLFEAQTPITAANFLKHVDEKRYFKFDPVINALSPSFIHRSPNPDFVVQGGGFISTRTSVDTPNQVTATAVDALPAIQNEPGISNTIGTIAMAKAAGNPDSATSQWFINIANNTSLDSPANSGGFTVFGQLVNNSLPVAQAIAAVPIYNKGQPFTELPLRDYNTSQPVRIQNLILVTQITRPLQFSVTTGNASVVNATIAGTKLILRGLQPGQTAIHVTATDLGGSQITQSFIATVTLGPPRLNNISTRARVGTGEEVLIGGFIVGEANSDRRILLRGVGPSTNIPGALANPFLELYSGNSVIASNDNWGFSADEQAILDTGLAPIAPNESAIIRTFPASVAGTSYTVLMSGVGNTSGIGLVEAFDVQATPGAELLNLSARGFVGQNDAVMIGGFIVAGSGTQKLVLRGIGPSLADQGIVNELQDPHIDVRNAQGTMVDSNDDWMNGPDAAELQTLMLNPSHPKEAALVYETTGAGGTTVIVTGRGPTPTGVGLFEVFSPQ